MISVVMNVQRKFSKLIMLIRLLLKTTYLKHLMGRCSYLIPILVQVASVGGGLLSVLRNRDPSIMLTCFVPIFKYKMILAPYNKYFQEICLAYYILIHLIG